MRLFQKAKTTDAVALGEKKTKLADGQMLDNASYSKVTRQYGASNTVTQLGSCTLNQGLKESETEESRTCFTIRRLYLN